MKTNWVRCSLFVFVVIVMLLSIGACAVKPGASATQTSAVAPVTTEQASQPSEVKKLICTNLDPNMQYDVSVPSVPSTDFVFSCEDGFVKFAFADGHTIIGRVLVDDYQPYAGDRIDAKTQFDIVVPNATKGYTVVEQMQCFTNKLKDNGAPDLDFSGTVMAISDFEVQCSSHTLADTYIKAHFQIRPESTVTMPVTRTNGNIRRWNEMQVGDDLLFCSSQSDIQYVRLYPADVNVTTNLYSYNGSTVKTEFCIPGIVLDGALNRIQYEGHALSTDTGAAYSLDPGLVLGGYPFVKADDLQIGLQYVLCKTSKHSPNVDIKTSDEPTTLTWDKQDCHVGTYQGRDITVTPALSFWTIAETRYSLYNIDGAYVSPQQ